MRGRSACSRRRPGPLLREHVRAPRGWHRIDDADRPRRTPGSTLATLARAKTAGPSIGVVCDHIHQHEGAAGVRRILGLLALAKKHGPAVVEDAAKAALEVGVPTYRFVRRYLERRPPLPLTLRQIDPAHPATEPLPRSHRSHHRRPHMTLVELDRALRQLRLSGMASVLEARLRQAQTERLVPARPRLRARQR